MDKIDKIIAFENGELTEKEVIELFQELINTGEVWSLQGSYGRLAKQLIEAGLCNYRKERILKEYKNEESL